jgi:hypothetical protein
MFKDREPRAGRGKRIGILVYPNDARVTRGCQNSVSVSPRSHGAIDKRAASLRLKPLDNLFE